MSGDVHVRICESLGVRFPRATRLILGFESKTDAEQVMAVLPKRFGRFHLRIHPERTVLVRFNKPLRRETSSKGKGRLTLSDLPIIGPRPAVASG